MRAGRGQGRTSSHTGRKPSRMTHGRLVNDDDMLQRKRDRSQPTRNFDWPDSGGNIVGAARAAATQRIEIDDQRRSLNATGNRWRELVCSD